MLYHKIMHYIRPDWICFILTQNLSRNFRDAGISPLLDHSKQKNRVYAAMCKT